MCVELKIKSKHLSLESKVIRFEEAKIKKQIKWLKTNKPGKNAEKDVLVRQLNSIREHRKWDVRNENRATFLARAFLTGQPYLKVEPKRKPCNEYIFNTFVMPRLMTMVIKYSPRGRVPPVDSQTVKDWLAVK